METKIELEKYYLNEENIAEITANRKTKTLKIFQSNKESKFFNLTDIESLEFKERYKMNNQDSISLVVINGDVIKKNERKDYYVEHNAVKKLEIARDVDGTKLYCSGNGSTNILILTTK